MNSKRVFASRRRGDAAGPFDWMRSDCQGITHLVENGFEDGDPGALSEGRVSLVLKGLRV